MISAYSSVYAIGHKAIEALFSGPVIVEEKVDGSQFSFGVYGGELRCRSHHAQLLLDHHDSMFSAAVETVRRLAPLLRDGWTYRGEYLQKPKHNTLAYDRIPNQHIIGFDIMVEPEGYLDYDAKAAEFARIGLETVPLLFNGVVTNFDMFKAFLDRVSILGGSKIEGVVCKNYALFTQEKKVAMGKYVSEAFKEVHAGEWKKNNPVGRDIIQKIIEQYKTPARWSKAVQHLREAGQLDNSPKDIGALMREVGEDILKECKGEIIDILFAWAWKNIQRGVTAGLPEWYKDELAKSAFEVNE